MEKCDGCNSRSRPRSRSGEIGGNQRPNFGLIGKESGGFRDDDAPDEEPASHPPHRFCERSAKLNIEKDQVGTTDAAKCGE